MRMLMVNIPRAWMNLSTPIFSVWERLPWRRHIAPSLRETLDFVSAYETDLREFTRICCQQIASTEGLRRVIIGLPQGSGKIAFISSSPNLVPLPLAPADQILLGLQSQISTRDDLMDDFGFSADRSQLESILTSLGADLIFPLKVKDQLVGWLFVGGSKGPFGCTTLQVHRLKKLAHEVSLSLFLFRNLTIPQSAETTFSAVERTFLIDSFQTRPKSRFDAEDDISLLSSNPCGRDICEVKCLVFPDSTRNPKPNSQHVFDAFESHPTITDSKCDFNDARSHNPAYDPLQQSISALDRSLGAARSDEPILELWRHWALLANQRFRSTLERSRREESYQEVNEL